MAQRPRYVFLIEKVLQHPVVQDQHATGVESRQLVRLSRIVRRPARCCQAGAQQIVDLATQTGAALDPPSRQRGGDVIVERQRRSHEPSIDGGHQDINRLMRRPSFIRSVSQPAADLCQGGVRTREIGGGNER
jgi:hypothetical protein